jgi:FkbM family methyltransferase
MKHVNQNVLRFVMGENRYGAYCIPISAIHRPAAQIVLKGRVHEPKTIEYILEHCGDGDVLSAGAFFGDFLPALGTHVATNAKVWSFEPNDENFRCAKITCFLNNLRNVKLFHAGLGDVERNVFLDYLNKQGDSRGGRSTIVEAETDGKMLQKTKLMKFDSLLPEGRKISVIQLDVEGFELVAIKGAIETIRRDRPVLILETVPDDAWFSETVLDLGYRKSGTLHGRNTIFHAD